MTDPIADMLTRIRNASAVRKPEIVLPYSKIKYQVAQILSGEGFVGKVEEVEDGKFKELKIELKYNGRESLIRHIKRISTPGRRVYRGHDNLPVVLNNLGIAILSTSQGLMTNVQARKKKVGGEVLCEIY